MNYPLVSSFHTSAPSFNINREPSESILKERVLILYSFKSMLKEFALLGRRMIDMFHFAAFDHRST